MRLCRRRPILILSTRRHRQGRALETVVRRHVQRGTGILQRYRGAS